MTRFCTSCGAPVDDQTAFCTRCGAQLGSQPTAAGEQGNATAGAEQITAEPQSPTTAPMPSPAPAASSDAPGPHRRTVPVYALVVMMASVVAVCGVVLAVLALHPLGANQATQQEATEIRVIEPEAKDEADDDIEIVEKQVEPAEEPAEPAPAEQSEAPVQQEEPQAQQPSAPNNYYVCPDSATHVYSDNELYAMSADELELARNEIYARYGRGFSTDYLQAYFDSQAWYTRKYSPEEFDAMASPLNATEQQNVDNMLRVEKDLRN
ncbi:YARHG domain-containing protein [Collinsella tanakaei]|uniref:YARHG domain-containing protein n=1 Tax=Collinsella tanakaei TaxID=626935 RepID=UPI0025A3E9A8|nr:YARHG domain-containing protein [Collinsella tanakaei]MDM8299435.1 YARHG domain-containing protein [Collinsella tanakaei]